MFLLTSVGHQYGWSSPVTLCLPDHLHATISFGPHHQPTGWVLLSHFIDKKMEI